MRSHESQGESHHAVRGRCCRVERSRRYRPLPVVPLDHASRGGPPTRLLPIFATANFFVGPLYHDVYPSREPWADPLPRDEAFYHQQYQRWGDDPPTSQMQRMALPEGVLADGGVMSGYLYFENATAHESRLTFKAELDDQAAGDTIAAFAIPFRVQ